MKKVIMTKYITDEWECWQDENNSHWYIGETGTNSYLAQTYSEANARLIVAAPEMYKLLKDCAEALYINAFPKVKQRILELLARIDGEEAEA